MFRDTNIDIRSERSAFPAPGFLGFAPKAPPKMTQDYTRTPRSSPGWLTADLSIPPTHLSPPPPITYGSTGLLAASPKIKSNG